MAAVEDMKCEAFFKAINEASEERKAAILAEVESYKAKQLKKAEAEAEKKYNEYIAEATGRIALSDGVETEKHSAEIKKEIASVRKEIENRVFSAVKEKLKAFCETPEYRELLVNSAEKMAKLCGGAGLTIFIREKDLKYADALKSVSPGITVSTDNSIEIGGIYGICAEKRIKLNDLLETRLSSQKSWFYENSGLTL